MELIITFLVGLFIVAGAIIEGSSKNESIENITISLALSTMVILALTDLLPEAKEYLDDGILLVVLVGLGFGLLMLLDHFSIDDHHDINKDHYDDHEVAHIGVATAIAIILHNIVEGMAVYSVSLNSVNTGLLMGLSIGLHNIPFGMVIASTLKHESKSKKNIILLLVSISTFIGGLMMKLVAGLISDFLLGAIMALSLGMVGYIIVMELIPFVLESENKKQSLLSIVLGVLLMVVSHLLG